LKNGECECQSRSKVIYKKLLPRKTDILTQI